MMQFNEQSLRTAIAGEWGEHGAHMDVYDELLRRAANEGERMSNMSYDPDDDARERAAAMGHLTDVARLSTEVLRLRTELEVANNHIAMVEAINAELREDVAERQLDMEAVLNTRAELRRLLGAERSENDRLNREMVRAQERTYSLMEEVAHAREERDGWMAQADSLLHEVDALRTALGER